MWACTGIGLAVGAGLYLPAVAATVVTLVALKLFRDMARYLPREQNVMLRLDLSDPEAEDQVRALLKQHHARILFVGRERCLPANTEEVEMSLSIRSGAGWRKMLQEMDSIEGISCYSWKQAEVP